MNITAITTTAWVKMDFILMGFVSLNFGRGEGNKKTGRKFYLPSPGLYCLTIAILRPHKINSIGKVYKGGQNLGGLDIGQRPKVLMVGVLERFFLVDVF